MSGELVEFLLACIAEDEAEVYRWDSDARALVAVMWTGDDPGFSTAAIGSGAEGEWVANGVEVANARHVRVVYDPARVLAECEAKRRILTLCVEDLEDRGDGAIEGRIGRVTWDVLCALALAYADRPGYREEWRP